MRIWPLPVITYLMVVSSRAPSARGRAILSAYADLGTETELLPVGKARRRVHNYRCGVDLAVKRCEASRSRVTIASVWPLP